MLINRPINGKKLLSKIICDVDKQEIIIKKYFSCPIATLEV